MAIPPQAPDQDPVAPTAPAAAPGEPAAVPAPGAAPADLTVLPGTAPEPAPPAAPQAAPQGAPAPGETGDPARRLSAAGTFALGTALLAEAFVCLAVLVSVWTPLTDLTAQQAGAPRTAAWSVLGLGPWELSATTAMLLVVLATSGLGSFVHAATSFATYVGNRRLYASWVAWYLLRTGIGAALAVLVYFLLRGGLFANGTDTAATNPYGFAGIAGLCGLFSKQATDKLREVFDTILTTSDGAGDDERRDSASGPDPQHARVPAGH